MKNLKILLLCFLWFVIGCVAYQFWNTQLEPVPIYYSMHQVKDDYELNVVYKPNWWNVYSVRHLTLAIDNSELYWNPKDKV